MVTNEGTAPLALVVDDDPMQQLVVSSVLKKFGVTCVAVSTSREFIEKLKVCRPDFCLIDLNIERMGVGFKIVEAVRKVLGPKPNLIVVSADSNRKSIAHALELGANDFIIKPMDRNVLISKVSHYVSTAALVEARMPLLPVPNGGSPAQFWLDLEVQSVDEFGLNLLSPHLVFKGQVISLGGPLLAEITGQAQEVRLTVTSTWTESVGLYGALAEFDAMDATLMTSVRKWLALKAASPH